MAKGVGALPASSIEQLRNVANNEQVKNVVHRSSNNVQAENVVHQLNNNVRVENAVHPFNNSDAQTTLGVLEEAVFGGLLRVATNVVRQELCGVRAKAEEPLVTNDVEVETPEIGTIAYFRKA